jgi:hypothetical protein
LFDPLLVTLDHTCVAYIYIFMKYDALILSLELKDVQHFVNSILYVERRYLYLEMVELHPRYIENVFNSMHHEEATAPLNLQVFYCSLIIN